MNSDQIVTTSFRLPSELKQKIAAIAEARHRPRGYIMVEALNHYIECQTNDKPKANGSMKKKAGTR